MTAAARPRYVAPPGAATVAMPWHEEADLALAAGDHALAARAL